MADKDDLDNAKQDNKISINLLNKAIIVIILTIITCIIGFIVNRPTIQTRLHEACMWKSGKSKKFHCVDKQEDTCEPITNVYPELHESDAYNFIYQHPTRYTNQPIYWYLNQTSICVCLDGYNVHLGECKKFLPEWPESIGVILGLNIVILIYNRYLYYRCIYFQKVNKKYNDYPITIQLIFALILLIGSVSVSIHLQTRYSDYP